MKHICSVCFNATDDSICPHCGANLQQNAKMRQLETQADQRDTLTTLHELLRVYEGMGRLAAAGRILGKLASYALRIGDWQAARRHLEHILSIGEAAGTPEFLAETQRRLGGLLGRIGELPLALHLLAQAESAGDSEAVIERLRLEIEYANKKEAFALLDSLSAKGPLSPKLAALRLEALARFETIPADELAALNPDTESDPYLAAMQRRALGLALTQEGTLKGALDHLGAAAMRFLGQGDPYEAARTQVDLARAYLLTETDSRVSPPAARETAQQWLSQAIFTFRRLGTPGPDSIASELAASLAIGRATPPTRPDTTSGSMALVWMALDGEWEEIALETAVQLGREFGALVEPMLGGMAYMFGTGQHQGDMSRPIELALTLADLMHHHNKHFKGSAGGRFHLAAGSGMFSQDERDVIGMLRALPNTRLMKELRATQVPNGVIFVNETLYLSTHERYTYEAKDDETQFHGWILSQPQLPIPTHTPPKRAAMPEYEGIFREMVGVLDRFKLRKAGGMIAVIGEAGTGKSRLLETLAKELETHTQAWLIHLKGREAPAHEPFGAIRSWLGSEIHGANPSPREKRLAYIATFRRSLLGLLNSKPLLLVVDDAHLLDSASLDTLRATLPLMGSHPLLILVSARPDAENGWFSLVESTRRAIPERCIAVRLPDALSHTTPKTIVDFTARHLLACAAVLGDRFPTLALRSMSGGRHFYANLHALKESLHPTKRWGMWAFTHTAERDAVYSTLAPSYRAVLHWYARQALKKLGLPEGEHIHLSGLSEPALKISIRAAAAAAALDAPAEALLHYDRAITHYQAETPPFDLMLARAIALMSLGDLNEAQNALQALKDAPDLDARQEIALLIAQGELYYRVGEFALLFQLYDQAAIKQRELTDNDPNEHISLLYAQALARFKRGEIEMARSLTGGALHAAQQAHIDSGLAYLWELLAEIHIVRGETEQASRAVHKAIQIYREEKQNWSLIEPYERSGMLLLSAGDLEKGAARLKEALALAEAAGANESVIRLHKAMGQIAMYRGEFGSLTAHQTAALNAALFSEDGRVSIFARAALAEGLALEGRRVAALQQAAFTVQAAELDASTLSMTVALLALARVALSLGFWQDAESALARVHPTNEPDLRLALAYTRMELALAKNDIEAFAGPWAEARSLPLRAEDTFVRARIGLLVGRYHAAKQSWNLAAREIEQAARTFVTLGALYWYGRARAQLKDVAPHAPGYREGNKRSTQDNAQSIL